MEGERWLWEQLRAVREAIAANVVVLDADGLLDESVFGDGRDVVTASDWLTLRRAYEANDRGRSDDAQRQIIHVTSSEFRAQRDLPWDIEQQAGVAVVRWPHHRRWLTWRRHLDLGHAARLSALLEREPAASVAVAVARLFGVSLPALDAASELTAVAELRRQGFPAELWPEIADLLNGAEARGLAGDPPDTTAIQSAWAEWMRTGEAAQSAGLLSRNAGAIISFLQSGLLAPVPAEASDLPAWTQLGAVNVGPRERVALLLEGAPHSWPPDDADGWAAFAMWWGELRAHLARVAPVDEELGAAAEAWWRRADEAFRAWLHENYGLLLTSTRSRPVTVDKIGPFLARRLRGGARRVMLIVLDGLGMAQWAELRIRSGLEVVEPGASFAMIPTLTPHSRQAIFAGAPPLAFPDDLDGNVNEERHWRRFWATQGIAGGEVGYFKDRGADSTSIPPFQGERVFGVVALAIDQMLHESKVLPDPQLASNVRTWADHGFLSGLVERATADGFEVWITSDHGNLEATQLGLLQEGDLVDAPGRRVRFYSNRTLRERAVERYDGQAWDPPGYPADGRFPLFARGRGAWILGGNQVVHGGLSIDEVIVPFVRVRR